jgi:hypothetical protein
MTGDDRDFVGRPRHRLQDDIRMDLQDMGWDMDWIDLAPDRDRWLALVHAIMKFWVPSIAGIS